MANTQIASYAGTGNKLVTLDTSTTDLILAANAGNILSVCVLNVSGISGDSIVPQARLVGGAGLSIAFTSVAYINRGTGAVVAAGTAITADGVYSVPMDPGVEICVDFTRSAGTVKILYKVGTNG